MAYDIELAERIRELLAKERGIQEKKMFGGLGFLIDGNMAVTASGKGGVMIRLDPDEAEKQLRAKGAQPVEMRGRVMNGWIRVDADRVRTKRQLVKWVDLGVAFTRTLPPKRAR